MARPRRARMFGGNVKAARRRAGLTQEALAEAAAVSPETVSRIERGAFEPSLSTAIAISEALEISIDRLAGRPRGRRRTG